MPSSSYRAALAAGVGLVVAACGFLPGASWPGRDAPNVLFITIDTLRADHLGAYGGGRGTSPELDALAARSVVFEEATASAPWTLPTLASVITGEHASTHGCRDFGSVLDDSFTTLPERLLAAGYDTACVVSHLFVTSRHGLQQGVVHTDDSYAHPEVDPAQSVTSQVISDQGIRFLEQKRVSPDRAPWFLWLHYFDPHEDYVSHPGLSEAFVTPGEARPGQALADLYDGEIRYTDLHIGRVLAALEQDGFARDTIVVVVADHGEEFLEHGALGHGHTLHRELVHVPFLIRAPGFEARRVREVVRQVDLMPTVLELVGLDVPPGIAGASLVPAMRGQALEERAALAELDNGLFDLDSLRRGRFKLVRTLPAGTSVLYDLESDPDETRDVAGEHPDVVRALTDELEHTKQAAVERAGRFGTTRTLTLTPGLEEDLQNLGYAGAEKAHDEVAPR